MAKYLKRFISFKVLTNTYMMMIVMGTMTLASVLGFWFGSRATLRTEYPFLAVATPSMTPTLPVGTLIVVYGVPSGSELYAAYGDGDIIVFRRPPDFSDRIVHRAVEKVYKDGEWYIRTKGDYNPSPDFWSGPFTDNGFISDDLVIGKVVAWGQGLGHVFLFIRTPTGMFIFLLLILVVIFIERIPMPKRKKR